MQFGPGFSATFLYYFVSTAVVFTLVTAQALDVGLDGLPRQVGVLGGIAAGLAGAYFNRTISITLPVQGQKSFSVHLNQTLAEMGFTQGQSPTEDVLVYERSGLSKILSGKIYVQLEKTQATISGRSAQVKSLKKRLPGS